MGDAELLIHGIFTGHFLPQYLGAVVFLRFLTPRAGCLDRSAFHLETLLSASPVETRVSDHVN